jgi:hypothetical protein
VVRCRIRIYLPDEERDVPVVLCTEPPDNPSVSITNAVEQIAAEVISAHPMLEIPIVWIEHYADGARGTPQDRHTFDLVIFSHYEVREVLRADYSWRKEIGEPTWKPVTRSMVEALIGEPVR